MESSNNCEPRSIALLWPSAPIPRGRVKVEHIDTKLNSADLLTKPLPLPVFEMHKRRLMGMG